MCACRACRACRSCGCDGCCCCCPREAGYTRRECCCCGDDGDCAQVEGEGSWSSCDSPSHHNDALVSHHDHDDASAFSPCPPPGPCILLMNSSSLASRYWQIHTHTCNTDTYIHWPTWENWFAMTWARLLQVSRKCFPPRKSDWHIWRKCILTNTCIYIQYMHIHAYTYT